MEKLTKEQQDRLNKYLKDKKLTKYRIASDLHMSASTIANYINGKTKPDTTKWELVRNYLDMTDEWLLTGQNIVTTPKEQNPKKPLDPKSIEATIEEIRLMFQARDDQYMNLHKDMERLSRNLQEILAILLDKRGK